MTLSYSELPSKRLDLATPSNVRHILRILLCGALFDFEKAFQNVAKMYV